MADPNRRAVIEITYRDERIPPAERMSLDKGIYLAQLGGHIEAMGGGAMDGTLTITTSDADPVAASGTLTISSGSGSVAALINGVSIAVAWTTSDANTASLLAAAINASVNPLVEPFVVASAALGVVTVTAMEPGVSGNTITLAASGTGITASGNRLTGGAAGGNSTTSTITV